MLQTSRLLSSIASKANTFYYRMRLHERGEEEKGYVYPLLGGFVSPKGVDTTGLTFCANDTKACIFTSKSNTHLTSILVRNEGNVRTILL